MAAKIIPVPSFDAVVFGATGDLTRRKLLPALYYRFRDGQIPDDSWIIGAARSDLSPEEFRRHAEEAIGQHVPPDDRDADAVRRFCARLDYMAIDASSDHGWDALRARLSGSAERVRVFYLATSPSLYGRVSQRLKAHGLVTPPCARPGSHPCGRARARCSR